MKELKVIIEVTLPDNEHVEVNSRVEGGEYDPDHPCCVMADKMIDLYGNWVNEVMNVFLTEGNG